MKIEEGFHESVGKSCVERKKKQGVVGIKEVGKFNRARLCKWRWRLLQENEAIWVEILKHMYEDYQSG